MAKTATFITMRVDIPKENRPICMYCDRGNDNSEERILFTGDFCRNGKDNQIFGICWACQAERVQGRIAKNEKEEKESSMPAL